MREREKNIGNEAGLLLHFQHAFTDVARQVLQARNRIAADRRHVA